MGAMASKVKASLLYRKANFVGNSRHVIVNGAGHTRGRLASVVAKNLLKGRPVTVVRCEKIVMNGSITKNLHKWQRFLRLWGNSNPRIRSHQHRKAPSMMFFRNIRASFKHKTNKGLAALAKLRCYDGVPAQMASEPLMKCEAALAHRIFKPKRKTTTLGELANRVGWKHAEQVEAQDQIRIQKAAEYNLAKQEIKDKLKAATEKAKSILTSEERQLIDEVGIYN